MIFMPDRPNPLHFYYQNFATNQEHEFDRTTVLDLMEKIFRGYGVGQLYRLLQRATKDLLKRL